MQLEGDYSSANTYSPQLTYTRSYRSKSIRRRSTATPVSVRAYSDAVSEEDVWYDAVEDLEESEDVWHDAPEIPTQKANIGTLLCNLP